MTASGADSIVVHTRELLAQARVEFGGTQHEQRIAALVDRFEAPLRVAIAGKIKAGKSTLLNALVGAKVAATDAAECTRVVTWYQDGLVYDLTIEMPDSTAKGTFRQSPGGVTLDLGGRSADDIERLVVTWPSQELRTKTLIDSPGIGSLSRSVSDKTLDALGVSGAHGDDGGYTAADADDSPIDAVIYLMKHLHAQDVELLRAFNDTSGSIATPVNAIAVLSRADEVGAGRIDALDSARQVARRLSREPAVRRIVQSVVPVAGLLAETAATFTEDEFHTVAALAALPDDALDRLMMSVDLFVAERSDVTPSVEARRHLIERLGAYGVKVAVRACRSGSCSTATQMATLLVDASGLNVLRDLLDTLFVERQGVLKARSALNGLSSIVMAAGLDASHPLAVNLDRVVSSDHSIEELRVLSAVRSGLVSARTEILDDMERLIGAHGQSPASRLGLDPNASTVELRSAGLAAIDRWRRRSENPLTAPSLVALAPSVVRSCEGLVASLEPTS